MQLIMSGILNATQVRFLDCCSVRLSAENLKLVGVSTSLWTMDRFGRRPLLLWGSFCMTVSHVTIAILVGMFSSSWPSHRGAGWTSVAFVSRALSIRGASDIDNLVAIVLHA